MIYHGDCLDVLKMFEANSIDALVTDPPAGISFMGKEWDNSSRFVIRMTDIFEECYRLLKPGAHGFVWALPRTSHRTAIALEDAGFEIRDVVTHLFGSGFPKSMDISKAIDKHAGAEREVIGESQWANRTPNGCTGLRGNDFSKNKQITAPNTIEAKQWQGWGTALKPASEHWILVRKPLSEKTVAANVLKHGTGGINIDASRIEVSGTDPNKRTGEQTFYKDPEHLFGHSGKKRGDFAPQGRFPSNLILSHNPKCFDARNACIDEKTINDAVEYAETCAVRMLDEQSGTTNSTIHTRGNGIGKGFNGSNAEHIGIRGISDSGGASRFFYCAKTSKSERNAGLDTPSSHPTVKPKKLMSYLINMITPPGGTVLDPFMGSGSTGVACAEKGFQFIGIEKELDYFQIAEKRIAYANQNSTPAQADLI